MNFWGYGGSLLALLATAGAANAYTQCSTTALAGPGATIAEEASNPVVSGKYLYAGLMAKNNLAVLVSSDWGATLQPAETLDARDGKFYDLRLGASGSNVYALWGRAYQGKGILMFAASQRFGAAGSWTKFRLGRFLNNLPQIAADGDNVHILYHALNGNMVMRNSSDAGRTLSDPVVIGPGASEEVAATVGTDVYASWSISDPRPDTMIAVSHDNGKTFAVSEISKDRPSGSNEPMLAVDRISGRVSLVWRENQPSQGVYLQSLDNGNTWSAPLVIDGNSRQYMIADDGTYIYTSYLKLFTVNDQPDWQVMLTISKDGGKTFPSAKNMSGPTGIQSLFDDDERPIPWASDGNGAFRLTGVKADGVHIWNGRNGVVFPSSETYLGPGAVGAPAINSALWQSPNQVVSYGVCQ